MDDIKLFNPNDKPFGKLSNNAYYPMTIDGKNYPTVTNYILSNMVATPLWKTILQNTQVSGARGVNSEMMNAIDFFIESSKRTKNSSIEITSSRTENRGKRILVLHKLTGLPTDNFLLWKNSQISLAIISINKSNRMFSTKKATKYLRRAIRKYKQTENPSDFLKVIR